MTASAALVAAGAWSGASRSASYPALDPRQHSGLLALVSDPGDVKIRRALERAEASAESTIAEVEADDIKAAAKEAQQN